MKNLRAIILLFLANSISGIAQGISMIAIPWYFQEQGMMSTHGWIYIVTNCISFFWVPFGGTLIDRHNRKNVFLVLNGICTIIILSIALLGYFNGALPWYLVSLVFTTTFLNYNLHYPNLYAFIQEITDEAHYEKITSYMEIQGQLSAVMAGAFAALLLQGTSDGLLNLFGFYVPIGVNISPWSIYEIFIVDGATYAASFLLILLIKYTPLKHRHGEVGSVINRLKTGIQFLKGNRPIFIFGVASYGIFITVLLTGFYLDAIYVDNQLNRGADVFAAGEMYFALGAIFSGFTIRFLMRRFSATTIIIILTALVGIRFIYLSQSVQVAAFYLLGLFLGIANAATRIARVNYLFRKIPNQVFGRAASIFFMGNILARNGFILLFNIPFFLHDRNIRFAFLILGVFLLLCMFVLIAYSKAIERVPNVKTGSIIIK